MPMTAVKRSFATLAGACALALGSAFATAGTPPSVLVFDQGAGKSVELAYANLPANGYVNVHASDAGKLSRIIIGTVELKAGDHRNVKIALSEPLQAGKTYWVSMYTDTDGKPGFDPKADLPIWEALPTGNAFVAR